MKKSKPKTEKPNPDLYISKDNILTGIGHVVTNPKPEGSKPK